MFPIPESHDAVAVDQLGSSMTDVHGDHARAASPGADTPGRDEPFITSWFLLQTRYCMHLTQLATAAWLEATGWGGTIHGGMSRPVLDVAGRVVLITGAARGIGLDSARRLAARGARIALLDVDGVEAERAAALLGPAAVAYQVDVTDAAGLLAVVQSVVEHLGGIDVVIANAGIEPPAATMLSVDKSEFDRVLDVNLHGVWNTVKAALPHVVERQGHVLLVSSIYAFMNGSMVASYAMSKAAVEQLGRALRTELAPHGATAGVAYFSFIDTDLVRRAFASEALASARRVLPAWVTCPIEVERAGEAIARGVERRAAQVTVPEWVAPVMLRRGMMAKLDGALSHNRHLREAIRIAEAPRDAAEVAPSGPPQQ
ncbi:MAG: short-chain alcohol dehydrogenase [Chloroflexi bacterium]|jgi:NAD(P)-dependent dehydrogenase (short-subunit alcohol dehydrogenase family)|nr:short-chain alcohol dehydrogenase [Chloroflexota bacterium]